MSKSENRPFTSFGIAFPEPNEHSLRRTHAPHIVMIGDEPFIEVIGLDNKERTYSLEELWDLGSNIIMDRYQRPLRLAQELFYWRGVIGGNIVWLEAGYCNKGQTVKSTKLSNAMSPVLKATKKNRKAPLSKEEVLPTLKFGMIDNVLSWYLTIENQREVITKVAWNDREGIASLAAQVLDKEYCITMYALGNPEKSSKLFQDKAKYRKEIVLFPFLKQYTCNIETLRTFFNRYRSELERDCVKILGDGFSVGAGGSSPLDVQNPDKYQDRFPIGLVINLRVWGRNQYPLTAPKDLPRQLAWEQAEAKAWEKMTAAVEEAGFFVINTPNTPKDPSSMRTGYIVTNYEVAKDYIENKGSWPELMKMVEASQAQVVATEG